MGQHFIKDPDKGLTIIGVLALDKGSSEETVKRPASGRRWSSAEQSAFTAVCR